ncbi:unnamed protein product [Pleuronectes platessa]|uniref:Uncharacterized protein n=1 Tax=Pleuronectes platessa TaxID=8262 RepID=A0A9N7V6W7_PLEPL|nr:unnamed protein product [Pleuronectes platessa]
MDYSPGGKERRMRRKSTEDREASKETLLLLFPALECRQACGGRASVDLQLTLLGCTYTDRHGLTQGLHPYFIAEIYMPDCRAHLLATEEGQAMRSLLLSQRPSQEQHRANHTVIWCTRAEAATWA